jgi:hypothetical protein
MPHPVIQYLASDGVRQGLHRRFRRPSANHTHEGSSDLRNGIFHLVTGAAVAIALSASAASAQKKYDVGATDTEIKIGQTVPFSGPASAYAGIGKTQAAYLKMIDEQAASTAASST